MRFSLQSLAICLVSSQARFALAGPCRPLTTTSVGGATTTATSKESSTTTLSEDSTTTVEGVSSTVSSGEVSTTTELLDLSTTTTLAEESTTTTFLEESTTTTLADTTTTALAVTTTTTLAEEAATTTAAETTTTTSAPEPSFYARYSDGTEVGAYLQPNGFIGITEDGSVEAEFALETDTSRLYLTKSDGSKLYAYTVIPTGGNYGFLFDTFDNINQYPNTYHFIACTAGDEQVLTCSSEVGPTVIYWYKPGSSPNFYGNLNSAVANYAGNLP
ncbi:hypothetical protein ACLX1H_003065 [Fusarium chlamydosporum]